MSSDRVALEIEVDIHVLSEPGRVVVPVCLCVAERFQDHVAFQKDACHPLDLQKGKSSRFLFQVYQSTERDLNGAFPNDSSDDLVRSANKHKFYRLKFLSLQRHKTSPVTFASNKTSTKEAINISKEPHFGQSRQRLLSRFPALLTRPAIWEWSRNWQSVFALSTDVAYLFEHLNKRRRNLSTQSSTMPPNAGKSAAAHLGSGADVGDSCDVIHNNFGSFCFSGSRLAWNKKKGLTGCESFLDNFSFNANIMISEKT